MAKQKIIFENKDVVVIDKSAGVSVHNKEPSIVSWLIEKYPEIVNVGEDKTRPGIVHRLDKETSGVLIIAKNQAGYLYLKKQFKQRKVEKVYSALVIGRTKEEGKINAPIGRSKTNRKKRCVGVSKGCLNPKFALTLYKAIKYFQKYTLLEVSPETGRTHQIRVHLTSINHPIAGEKLYSKRKRTMLSGLGGRPAQTQTVCSGRPAQTVCSGRHFLHAYSLSLKLPGGEKKTFVAELPLELEKVLKSLP